MNTQALIARALRELPSLPVLDRREMLQEIVRAAQREALERAGRSVMANCTCFADQCAKLLTELEREHA